MNPPDDWKITDVHQRPVTRRDGTLPSHWLGTLAWLLMCVDVEWCEAPGGWRRRPENPAPQKERGARAP